MTTQVASPPAVERNYRFPPFPSVPDGVTIIPFKHFKERGIQIFAAADGVERDGLGLPTIALRIKHDTDGSKSNPNKKRKKSNLPGAEGGAQRREWWEEWEEGESLRNHGPYDVSVAPADRVHQAAVDFQKYRKFPPGATDLQRIWDHFKLFTGLMGTPPVSQQFADEEDALSDASDDEEDVISSASSPDDAAISDEDGGKVSTGQKRKPASQSAGREKRPRAPDRLDAFLGDPERAVKVFLSSYMKDQGLVWAQRNLLNAPRIVRFFLAYLVRNRVLPDRTSARALERAIQVVDTAADELPRTARVAHVLPGVFGGACQGAWGRRA
ncbi:hypothetical protein B0H10DRAFT_2440054, partial [Mycena sp. CBHHK59/15]